MGRHLGEQVARLLLHALDGVGTGDPARRRLVSPDELDQSPRELRGIAALLTQEHPA